MLSQMFFTTPDVRKVPTVVSDDCFCSFYAQNSHPKQLLESFWHQGSHNTFDTTKYIQYEI